MNHYIFVRHGESVANANKVIAGVTNVALSPNGIEQAKELAKALQGVQIDMAVCSTLLRAKQTMQTLNSSLNLPTTYHNDLCERNYGKFEGQVYDKMNNDPQGVAFWQLEQNVQVKDAETVQDYYNKVKSFFEALGQTHQNKTILIVAHGGVYRVLHHMLHPKEGTDLLKYHTPNTTPIYFDM